MRTEMSRSRAALTSKNSTMCYRRRFAEFPNEKTPYAYSRITMRLLRDCL